MVSVSGFRVWGLGFRVQGLGFRDLGIEDLGDIPSPNKKGSSSLQDICSGSMFFLEGTMCIFNLSGAYHAPG